MKHRCVQGRSLATLLEGAGYFFQYSKWILKLVKRKWLNICISLYNWIKQNMYSQIKVSFVKPVLQFGWQDKSHWMQYRMNGLERVRIPWFKEHINIKTLTVMHLDILKVFLITILCISGLKFTNSILVFDWHFFRKKTLARRENFESRVFGESQCWIICRNGNVKVYFRLSNFCVQSICTTSPVSIQVWTKTFRFEQKQPVAQLVLATLLEGVNNKIF